MWRRELRRVHFAACFPPLLPLRSHLNFRTKAAHRCLDDDDDRCNRRTAGGGEPWDRSFRLDKGRGQHLLTNPRVLDSIARLACLRLSDTVLEIGPGTGNLTVRLLQYARRVVAVEIDPRMVESLLSRVSGLGLDDRLTVITGDAVRTDFPEFDICVANIPYGISSPLIAKLLYGSGRQSAFRSAVLLLQKEFAKRLVATPGDSEFNRLAANVRLVATVEMLMNVSKKDFVPCPKVDSSLVRIQPRSDAPEVDLGEWLGFTRTCFTKKNKTLGAIFKQKKMIAELYKKSKSETKPGKILVHEEEDYDGDGDSHDENDATVDFSELDVSEVVQFKEKINGILKSVGYEGKRPSKLSNEEFLHLLQLFNQEGILCIQQVAKKDPSTSLLANGIEPKGRRQWQEEPLVSKEESNDDLSTPSSSDSEYSIDEEEAESDESNEGAVQETQPENAPAPPPDKPPRPASSGRKKVREFPLLWEKWEKENYIWINNKLKSGDEVSDFEGNGTPEIVDPSPDIKLPLLRFQKEWLAWALKQECSVFRGGILADEMGMGKTIQAISLVLKTRSLGSQHAWSGLDLNVPCSSSVLPDTKCTLVVCPVVAVIQWVGEIDKHTEKGSVKVLVYHGANRDKTKYDFDDYDFVITTYSTIESEFRKNLMPPKEMCKYCHKMFYPNKMRTHLKYFCGPYACKTEKQARQASRKKDGKTAYKTKKHYASGKKVQSSDKRILGSSPGSSILHSVKWQRIILDEAHFIKDRRCNTAKAVFALESLYKWALSGTPLQNRVGELYSLVRFLQIWPYSLYFCKDCDCKILDYGSSRDCVDCPHSRVRHFCWWNRFIANPIQSEQRRNDGKRAMTLLRERILKSIVLRRTKKSRASDLALPPRIVYLRRDSLDTKEQEFYEALYTQSRLQFDAYADAGTLLNNYAHIFDLLTRLRQAVDHPYLVLYSKTLEVANPSKDDIVKQDCGICHHPPEDMVVTSCGHVFCKVCLIDYSASLENVKCPLCSKPLTVDLTTKNLGEQITPAAIKGYKSGILCRLKDIGTFCTSTKIDALKEEIRDMVELDGSAKGIVFSQYTSFLDLIRFSLEKSGVKCVQLVGSMSLVERDRAITSFTNDSDCKIFLMSLKAGGVALNLTVASHVFLMDPWWNPAVECQAQDRIHRIGQYKPIRIVRFVIENTIEERILHLQEKKELMFQGTVGQNPDAMAKLTEADLRFLFQV